MKKLVLLLSISLVFTNCKKSTTTSRTTNPPPSTTSTNTLAGTWLNTSNSTDYFYLTTTTNNSQGSRYVLSHFSNYDLGQASYSAGPPKVGNLVDTVLSNVLTTVPGYSGAYAIPFVITTNNTQSNWYGSYYLLYNNPNMVVTYTHPDGSTTTVTFTQH